MARRLGKKFRPMIDRTTLGIGGAIDQPCNASMGNSAGAHGARFQRDIEPQSGQSIIADGGAGGP